MSWMETGYDGIGREEQRLATMSGPQRLWIPVGTRKELAWVDNDPAVIYEHNVKINGSWKNWMTCLRGIEDECPACVELGENTRYYIGYFTAVDTSEWTDKRGNKRQFEVLLAPAKLKSLKKLRRKGLDRIEAGGTGLRGCLYRAVRDDEKDPVIGGEHEFVREVDMDKLFFLAMYKGKKLNDLWDKAAANEEALATLQLIFKVELDSAGKPVKKLVPFNYMEVLKPMAARDMRQALRGASTGDNEPRGGTGRGSGSGSGSGSGARAEDVPF